MIGCSLDDMREKIKNDRQKQIKLERVPRAAAAAILSSAVSAFLFTEVPGVSFGNTTKLSVMLLCAVFTAVIELVNFSNAVLFGGSAVFFSVGAALFFLPIGNVSIYNALLGSEDISTVRVLLVVLLLCGALSLAICALNRSFVVRCIIAGGFLTMLIVVIWLRFRLLTIAAILITAYILIVLCQVCASKASCAKDTSRDMWFIVFSLLAAAIVFLLPAPNTRIQWERLFEIRVSQQLEQLGEKLGIERIDDEAGISESGYSEEQSSLGGWLMLNSEQKLQVEFSDRPHSDRLTGSIFDSYTGTGWECTMDIGGTGYGDAPETSPSDISAVSGYDQLGSAHISKIEDSSESDASLKTLFYPPYSYSVVSVDAKESANRDSQRLTFDQTSGLEYYALFFMQPCECILTASERSHYLALPKELPERVRELATTAVDGCGDDESKAHELMRILSDYEYEIRVSSLPEGRDFVDYFLFDLNEGYCEYFASAMAVLARCAGIPSRYVQGYSVNGNSLTVDVSSDDAHAWAELYIDGRWVVYDPVISPVESIASTTVSHTDESGAERDTSALNRILLLSYAITAAAAIIFIALKPYFRWGSRRRIKQKYGKSSGYPVILRCVKLLWVLSACGETRAEAETLTEFAARVCEECEWLDDATAHKLSHFLEQTGRSLYSPDGIVQHNKENIARAVRRTYIRKFGLIRYLRGQRRASL